MRERVLVTGEASLRRVIRDLSIHSRFETAGSGEGKAMADQPGLNVRMEQVGQAVVVTPEGEIAYTEATQFRQWMRKAHDASPERIVVDLTGIEYMNTPGVATLVEALQSAKKNKYRLVLAGMNTNVRSVFEVARLNTVFEIVQTREDALA